MSINEFSHQNKTRCTLFYPRALFPSPKCTHSLIIRLLNEEVLKNKQRTVNCLSYYDPHSDVSSLKGKDDDNRKTAYLPRKEEKRLTIINDHLKTHISLTFSF